MAGATSLRRSARLQEKRRVIGRVEKRLAIARRHQVRARVPAEIRIAIYTNLVRSQDGAPRLLGASVPFQDWPEPLANEIIGEYFKENTFEISPLLAQWHSTPTRLHPHETNITRVRCSMYCCIMLPDQCSLLPRGYVKVEIAIKPTARNKFSVSFVPDSCDEVFYFADIFGDKRQEGAILDAVARGVRAFSDKEFTALSLVQFAMWAGKNKAIEINHGGWFDFWQVRDYKGHIHQAHRLINS